MRTEDGTGSGWAGAEHPDWTKLDFGALSSHAINKARLSASHRSSCSATSRESVAAVRIAGAEAGGPIVMAAIKTKNFNFTSLSDAV